MCRNITGKYYFYKLSAGLLITMSIALNPCRGLAESITLAWDPPSKNTDGSPLTDLAGYRIYYGTEARTYTSSLDVSNVLTHRVEHLKPGTTYYFSVKAVNSLGKESVFSNEIMHTLPAGPAMQSDGISDLVTYWTFDDAAGDVVSDSSGHGLTGTIINNVNCNIVGPVGAACEFYGDGGGYLSIEDPGFGSIMDFSVGEAITIAAWIRSWSFRAGYSTIMIKGNYGVQAYSAGDHRAALVFFYKSNGQWHEYHSDSLVLNTTLAYHVAVTYTFGSAPSARVYVNGSEKSGRWRNGNGNAAPDITNDPLIIGATPHGEEWHGILEDIRIYHRALSSEEVLSLYR